MAARIATPKDLVDTESVVRSLARLSEGLSVDKTNNPAQASISDLDAVQVTPSPTYSQTEIEALAVELKSNSDKIDLILTALRAANILET